MYNMYDNYMFPNEFAESFQAKMNYKESPKVPLGLAISMGLPRLTVMELIPVATAEHKPFVWQFQPAWG